MKLSTIKQEVEEILVKYPEARASDEKLYGIYLSGKVPLVSAITFFLNFSHYEVASFETVSRCRRKIQETNEELRPPQDILDARDELQGSFFDFARGFDADV